MTEASTPHRFPRAARNLLFPLAILASILIILVPLPSAVMDLLLSLNLTISVLILLTVVFIRTPLEFSVFPAVLLSVTMFRLGLNIATTRLILSNAQEQGETAAGQVILAFSNFVASGNIVVGFVIFAIVVLIQFIVITKGATRISEVSARFTLDGLPGKQMAIDAELQNGTITPDEAARRRAELMDQVDFYGAMDGASKFVRGDAVAGICITLVNVIGGFCIGLYSGTMSLEEVASLYTRLTIGDGLVSQLPAFLVALAAALLVTRGGRQNDLPGDVVSQMFARPAALFITAVFLGLLIFTQLPKIPLLVLGLVCAGIAWLLESSHKRETDAAAQASAEAEKQKQEQDRNQVQMGQMLILDAVTLELGSSLTCWTADEASTEDLLDRIRKIRRSLAEELGVLLPNVRICSNDTLDATQYRIQINGASVAEYVLRADQLLAVESEFVTGELEGLRTTEPMRKTPAFWITPDQKQTALDAGYRVLAPVEVVMQHLAEVARAFAPELLSRSAAQNLLNELKTLAPDVVNSLIPEKLSVSEVQKVLQQLLAERVSIRALGLILEALEEHASQTKNPVQLAEYARIKLGRQITSQSLDVDGRLYVLTLSPGVEERVRSGFHYTNDGLETHLAPTDCEKLCKLLEIQFTQMQLAGKRWSLLVSNELRSAVRQLLEARVPLLPVLGFQEVPTGTRLEYVDMIDF